MTETFYLEYPVTDYADWYYYPSFDYVNDWYAYDPLWYTDNPEIM